MSTRGLVFALSGAAFGVGAVLATACSMDFDRFDPIDASELGAAPAVDAMPGFEFDTGGSAPDIRVAADTQGPFRPDTGGFDAVVDAGPDARDASPDQATCSAPPGCFDQAQSCGAMCTQQQQRCLNQCGGGHSCTVQCSMQEQSCVGQCASTCIGCAQDAGCPANNACFDAARAGD
jgi:hypothetical protein